MVKDNTTDVQTEEKIFRAATKVFEEKGFAAARMQEIADLAGINKALLHYYFRSKRHLFLEVLKPLMKKMFEKIFSVFMQDISFEQKIRLYYEEHINILAANPRLPLFLLNEIAQNPELLKGVAEFVQYNHIRTAILEKNARELNEFGITEKEMPQLMVTIVSMTIFPFAARDMIKLMIPQFNDTKVFNAFMQERKSFAADFVITALKNRKK